MAYTALFLYYFLKLKKIIGLQLTDNILLVSGVWQSVSVIPTYMHSFFPCRLLQTIVSIKIIKPVEIVQSHLNKKIFNYFQDIYSKYMF